jgi:hypothetical protein
MFLRQNAVIQLAAVVVHAQIAFKFLFKRRYRFAQSCFGKYHNCP